MDFSGIIGQQEIIGNLKRQLVEDRVGHAYIFSGPAGMGKKTIAHIFAGILLCENPQAGAMCGRCKACMLFENESNPDFHTIAIQEELSIGVDRIREIQSDVAIRPMYSKRKVYIVEDAVKMTDQAQSCLLKTFEEPPHYVVVILLADNYEKLLETIRSRAQHLQFKRYTHAQVSQALTERLGSENALIELAADYCDGNIGTALELAGSSDFSRLRNRLFELLPGIAKGRTQEILDYTAFLEDERDNADLLLDIMQLYYRDLLVMCETGNENMLINSDKRVMIKNNARTCCGSGLVSDIEAIGEVRRALKQNANYQLAIDNMLIKLREVY